jgi:hypothetical protein
MAASGFEYEIFIRSLIENVKEAGRDIRDLNHGNTNRIVGKSGQAHQIDVSFSDYSFQPPKFVLISCKDLSKKTVEPIAVKEWKFNIDDIAESIKPVDRFPKDFLGIIITTVGFSKGANLLATYCGFNMEIVSHGPKYSFQYQNVVQQSLADDVGFSDKPDYEVYRKCKDCGNHFRVIKNEKLCSFCL